MQKKLLVALFCASCIFSCTQEKPIGAPKSTGSPSDRGSGRHDQKLDSIAKVWAANNKWVDSVLDQPTVYWQSLMTKGKYFAAGLLNHVDSYMDQQSRLRLIFSCPFPEFMLSLSCDEKCKARLPTYDRFSYSNMVVFSVDSIRPKFIQSGSLDITAGGAASYHADGELSVTRVIYGKAIEVARP